MVLSSSGVPFSQENLDRKQYVYLATLTQESERYDEMAAFMKKLVLCGLQPPNELTLMERSLLSVAFKNQIDSRRASLVKDYRSVVESELSQVCAGTLELLDSHLIPTATASESKVFYLKMKGDYHRYLAEFKIGRERKEAAEDTMLAYKTAQDIAVADLEPTDPMRLGLALNFSVFYYEILKSPEKACGMAKQAFEEAVADLDILGEETYKDSTLICNSSETTSLCGLLILRINSMNHEILLLKEVGYRSHLSVIFHMKT